MQKSAYCEFDPAGHASVVYISMETLLPKENDNRNDRNIYEQSN